MYPFGRRLILIYSLKFKWIHRDRIWASIIWLRQRIPNLLHDSNLLLQDVRKRSYIHKQTKWIETVVMAVAYPVTVDGDYEDEHGCNIVK